MNRNSLPPLLRGIGTTVVLVTTVLSVIVARNDVRNQRAKREALQIKAEAAAATQPPETRNLAELKAELGDLRSSMNAETVAGEVMENPWFAWDNFLGTAIIASSFYAESYLRGRENDSSKKPK